MKNEIQTERLILRRWQDVEDVEPFQADPSRDFNHPRLPEGQRLCRHLFFCISKEEWSRDAH